MSERSLTKGHPSIMSMNSGKRDVILDAAQKVFGRRGFHSARTSEIAREAGVAEGTLYNYFPSRDDILIALIEERWQSFTDKIREKTNHLSDPNDKLKAILSAALKLFVTNRELAQIFLMETIPGKVFLGGPVAHRMADFLDLIEDILIEGKRRGKYHPDLDTKVARMVIYGTVHGILFSWMLKENASSDIRKRYRFSMLKANRTIRIILKTGLTYPSP